MRGLYPGWDDNINFVRSDNFFATPPTVLVPCGNQFEVVDSQIMVAVPQTCPTNPDGTPRVVPQQTTVAGRTAVTLFVSGDEGTTFDEACVPVQYLDEVGVFS